MSAYLIERDFALARAFRRRWAAALTLMRGHIRPSACCRASACRSATRCCIGLIVLVPLSAAFIKAAQLTWPAFVDIVTAPRVMASYRLTFGASFGAALINTVFGLLVAWVLVRYRFPGRRIADALIDLPFALPTAVAGIALAGLFAPNGWLGELLAPLGIKVAFTPLGVLVALTFIGLPFVVRTVQPVLETLPRELEEAAATLGASPAATFQRIVLPIVTPALLTALRLRSRARSASTAPSSSSPATCRWSRRSRRS